MENNKITGIGYLRVSTKKQADEGVSLIVQNRDVEKKLKELGCTQIFVYEDEGKSGKTIQGRDEFRKALEKAIQSKAKFFCTYDTSRFARNTEEAIKTIQLLRSNEIELVCVTAKFDDTPEGKLVFSMLATIDQFYSDQLGAKIKKSLKKKRESGYFMGKAPKGYSNIRINGQADIVINDDGLAIKQTLQNYLAGKIETLREVAKDLDANGFEPRKETSFQTAGRILKTPFYGGIFLDNTTGEYVDHVYEKLISKEDWFYIQEKISGRRRQTNHYKKHHPDYPLRSITYCHRCGRKLKGYPARGHGGVYYVYACPTKGCIGVVHTQVLHEQFGETLSHLEPDDGLLKLFEEILRRSLSDKLSKDSGREKQLQRQVETLRKEQEMIVTTMAKLTNPKVLGSLEKRYEDIEKRIITQEEALIQVNAKLSDENCEPIIQNGLNILKDPFTIWEKANPETKHHYQKWLFPEGMEFDHENGLRTRKKNLTYELLEALKTNDSGMVETVGFEPTSKSQKLRHVQTYLDLYSQTKLKNLTKSPVYSVFASKYIFLTDKE